MIASDGFIQLSWHWATLSFEQCLYIRFNECTVFSFFAAHNFWGPLPIGEIGGVLISLFLHGCCFQSLDTPSWYSDAYNYNVKISSVITWVGSKTRQTGKIIFLKCASSLLLSLFSSSSCNVVFLKNSCIPLHDILKYFKVSDFYSLKTVGKLPTH